MTAPLAENAPTSPWIVPTPAMAADNDLSGETSKRSLSPTVCTVASPGPPTAFGFSLGLLTVQPLMARTIVIIAPTAATPRTVRFISQSYHRPTHRPNSSAETPPAPSTPALTPHTALAASGAFDAAPGLLRRLEARGCRCSEGLSARAEGSSVYMDGLAHWILWRPDLVG